MELRYGPIVMLIIASLALSFCSGAWYVDSTYEPCRTQVVQNTIHVLPPSYYKEEYPSPITISDAFEIIREARYIHQDVVDRPQYANSIRGSVEYNQKWVTRYDQLRDLILLLEQPQKGS